MLRLTSLAAVLAGLFLTTSAQATRIDASTYGYPISNPFEATISGTPPNLRPSLPADEDIEQSDCLLIIGSNMAFAHPVLFRRLEEAKAKRPDMKVIVVDPRPEDAQVAQVALEVVAREVDCVLLVHYLPFHLVCA